MSSPSFIVGNLCLAWEKSVIFLWARSSKPRAPKLGVGLVCQMKCQYVILFQLLVSGFSSSTLQGKDDRVSSGSARFHHKNLADNTCESPVPEVSKQLIFKHVLFQSHPTFGTCIREDVLKWYKHCLHFADINAVLRGTAGTEPQTRDETPCRNDSTPSRSVDYLFIMEKPCRRSDSNTAETILNSIQSLVKLVQSKDTFHDVRTQFGFIVFSHEKKLEYTYAKDFSPDFPSDLRSHFLSSDVETECQAATAAASSYQATGDAVRVITRALKLNSKQDKFHQHISLTNNRSLCLWHRPYSDLHIMTVIDVSANYGKNKGSEDYEDTQMESWKTEVEKKITKLSEWVSTISSYPLTLHTFFSARNTAATSLLGDPGLAVRYRDCSHFKKAATLKSLITADKGDTLQALLLSRGVEYQVHTLKDLKNPRCILNISPALSTPLGIQPDFPNRCLVNKQNPEGSNGNMYCSHLHGWSERQARTLNSDSFKDKVPLAGKFTPSHADIAESISHSLNVNRDSLLMTEKLSINAVSSVGGDTHCKPLIVGRPRVRKWKHKSPFIKKMVEGREAVVLRGTVIETWPALTKWNMSYLSQNMETDVLNFVKCTNNYLTFDPDHRAPLKLNVSLTYTLANLSTTDFFRCVQSSDFCFDGYRGHYYFGAVPSPLKKDVSPDTLLYYMERDRVAAKQFMWISSAGMITHTHFDQDYNVFVQLLGRKRFTLWTPSQHEVMYVYPRVHPLWHKSRVNYQDVDVVRFPAFTRARAVQMELEPGDVLYVPPYTWHYVETLTPSVSLSTWSHDYVLYDHMNAIYRHDHKFDLLQSQRGTWFNTLVITLGDINPFVP